MVVDAVAASLQRLEGLPLIRSIYSESEWCLHLRRPNRRVLTEWLAWQNVICNRGLDVLEESLSVMRCHSKALFAHYCGELRTRGGWTSFWGVRAEIYVGVWLIVHGFDVDLPCPCDRRQADLEVTQAQGGRVTIEVSACFTPGEGDRRRLMWDLEDRVRTLALPTFIDLNQAHPRNGRDIKCIVTKLGEQARRMGDAIAAHKLKVQRDAKSWAVCTEPLGRGRRLTGGCVSLPSVTPHLTTDRLVRKLKEERSQLPVAGTNIICLDMSHVSEWYLSNLKRQIVPCLKGLDQLTPGVEQFLAADRDGRVAAILFFTRNLHEAVLHERLAVSRSPLPPSDTLQRLLGDWQSRDT